MKWCQRLSDVNALLRAFHMERRDLLRESLVAHEWKMKRAASALGVSNNTVIRWVRGYSDLWDEYEIRKMGAKRRGEDLQGEQDQLTELCELGGLPEVAELDGGGSIRR